MQAFVIDAFSFSQNRERREASTKIVDFARLSEECLNRESVIYWTLQGGVDQFGHSMLALEVHSEVQLMCQRCLGSFDFKIDSTSELILAKDEKHADDIESMLTSDENGVADLVDVIVGSKTFDVMSLIEDELLLALPLSPKHSVCTSVKVAPDGSAILTNADAVRESEAIDKVSPFAVLKKL